MNRAFIGNPSNVYVSQKRIKVALTKLDSPASDWNKFAIFSPSCTICVAASRLSSAVRKVIRLEEKENHSTWIIDLKFSVYIKTKQNKAKN